ncbi:MAG: TlpA family protein disulfide reductase [Deltaproteobacteria bacterium]|nr:TlpA family protein disulfide reductase [Deltaproteobacteria bacterium]
MKQNCEPMAGMERGQGRPRQPLWYSILLLVLVLLVASSPAEADLRIGSAVPQATIPDVNGGSVRIRERLMGKVALLHFWQIGCSSCKLEMPAMDTLYTQYRKKGLEILAVNVGQKKESVQAFAAELAVSYPLLIDPEQKNARLLGVTDVPRTYVIDRNGIVRYRILGGATTETLKKLILSLL